MTTEFHIGDKVRVKPLVPTEEYIVLELYQFHADVREIGTGKIVNVGLDYIEHADTPSTQSVAASSAPSAKSRFRVHGFQAPDNAWEMEQSFAHQEDAIEFADRQQREDPTGEYSVRDEKRREWVYRTHTMDTQTVVPVAAPPVTTGDSDDPAAKDMIGYENAPDVANQFAKVLREMGAEPDPSNPSVWRKAKADDDPQPPTPSGTAKALPRLTPDHVIALAGCNDSLWRTEMTHWKYVSDLCDWGYAEGHPITINNLNYFKTTLTTKGRDYLNSDNPLSANTGEGDHDHVDPYGHRGGDSERDL